MTDTRGILFYILCSPIQVESQCQTYLNLRLRVGGQACSCKREVKGHVDSRLPSLDQLQRPDLNTITRRAAQLPLSAMAKGRPPTREGSGGTGSNELNTDQIVPTPTCEEERAGLYAIPPLLPAPLSCHFPLWETKYHFINR